MSRDPAVYADAHKYNPERFMGSQPEQDPREWMYGFGRRICPGRLLADASVFVTVAMSLAAFDIRPIEGTPLPEYKTTGGPINSIVPFDCVLYTALAQWTIAGLIGGVYLLRTTR